MTAREEFDPKVVEAVARAMCKAHGTGQCAAACLSHSSLFTGGGKCPESPRIYDVKAALRTLRGLGVLAGPGECVVPREPTEAMHVAGLEASLFTGTMCEQWVTVNTLIYRAMLAAAPRAGTEGGQ